MPITLSFIMAFVGAALAMIIGISIFSGVSEAVDCESILSMTEEEFVKSEGSKIFPTREEAYNKCESMKDTAWTVIGILPIAMFFVLFTIMGGANFGLGIVTNIFKSETKIRKQADTTKIRNIGIMGKILLILGIVEVRKRDNLSD